MRLSWRGTCSVSRSSGGRLRSPARLRPAEPMRPLLGVLDGPLARCGTEVVKSAVRRIRCMCTRTLDAVEASSGGQRRALDYLGEVLVEEHPGDELLARSDADLVVEALSVVLDRVRREDQRLGDLGARQPACKERRDLTLAGGGTERLQADGR